MNRCTFGEHAPCNACGAFVSPVGPHVHAIGHASRRVLCGDCYDAIIIAARHTLLAVRTGGLHYSTAVQLRALLDEGAVVSYVQRLIPGVGYAQAAEDTPEST